jgi:hypothetical protein
MGRIGNQRTAGGGVLLTQGLIVSLGRNLPTVQIFTSTSFKLLLTQPSLTARVFYCEDINQTEGSTMMPAVMLVSIEHQDGSPTWMTDMDDLHRNFKPAQCLSIE